MSRGTLLKNYETLLTLCFDFPPGKVKRKPPQWTIMVKCFFCDEHFVIFIWKYQKRDFILLRRKSFCDKPQAICQTSFWEEITSKNISWNISEIVFLRSSSSSYHISPPSSIIICFLCLLSALSLSLDLKPYICSL